LLLLRHTKTNYLHLAPCYVTKTSVKTYITNYKSTCIFALINWHANFIQVELCHI